jgi:molecular chaperone GrpE
MAQDNPTPPEDAYRPEDDAVISEFDLTPDGAEPTAPPEAPETPEAPEADGVTAEDAADQAESVIDEQFQTLQAERDELEAKLMRTAADYQNFVRRSQTNLDATKQETLMKVAKAIVGVLDNFDRALEVDAQKTTAADVQQGVDSIRASLLQALEGFGLQKITVEPGDEFDPNLHEALMRQPTEGVESDHIAAQFMPGYVLNDQPVRPAQVSVAE